MDLHRSHRSHRALRDRRSHACAGVLIGLLCGASIACDDDDGSTSTSTSPGMTTGGNPQCSNDSDCGTGQMCSGGACVDASWVVGGDGAVLRVGGDGSSESHEPLAPGLFAIECNGEAEAWVVGAAGHVARTTDGGAHWSTVATGVHADLHDVEADHGVMVSAVGTDGAWLVIDDAGMRSIDGATGSLAGVAMGAAGLLAIADDGTVWSAEPAAGLAVAVAALPGTPRALDLAHDVARGVAVGRGGALWWSDDGVQWRALDSGTEHDLHAVQIARDGRGAIAVGASGTVVRVDLAADAPIITHVELATGDLRDIHLDWQGHGAAVGDDGIVALTDDAGLTFELVHTSRSDLVGVDALGPEHW